MTIFATENGTWKGTLVTRCHPWFRACGSDTLHEDIDLGLRLGRHVNGSDKKMPHSTAQKYILGKNIGAITI